jgi:ATPases involved in chromosome partitioning
MKSIAFGTLKGGTGKTTSCFNLAGALALNPDNKILLIDGDPQCNLTNDIGIDCSDMERNNIRTIFENKKIEPSELIIQNTLDELPNIDIIPSNILLIKTEMQMVSIAGREKLLANYIERNLDFFSQYTHIIFDTNPNLGVVNQNIFYFVNSIVLVSDVSLNAIQGAELFTFLWEENIEDLGIENNIRALIINNFDKRINLAKDLQDYYLSEEEFKDILIETPIPGSVAMKDTSINHAPIVVLQPQHQAANAVKKVVKELIAREVF